MALIKYGRSLKLIIHLKHPSGIRTNDRLQYYMTTTVFYRTINTNYLFLTLICF